MAFQGLLRQLNDIRDGTPGCFASAGRGLGHTMRSVEDYVTEVIQRGVCYIDNTIEDFDEEVTVEGRELERGARSIGKELSENLLPDEFREYTDMSPDHEEDGSLRHRSRHDVTNDREVMQSEVWDINATSGSHRNSGYSYSSLACAPLVDTESSPADVYRLSADSSVVPVSPQDPTYSVPLCTSPEEHDNAFNETLHSRTERACAPSSDVATLDVFNM